MCQVKQFLSGLALGSLGDIEAFELIHIPTSTNASTDFNMFVVATQMSVHRYITGRPDKQRPQVTN